MHSNFGVSQPGSSPFRDTPHFEQLGPRENVVDAGKFRHLEKWWGCRVFRRLDLRYAERNKRRNIG